MDQQAMAQALQQAQLLIQQLQQQIQQQQAEAVAFQQQMQQQLQQAAAAVQQQAQAPAAQQHQQHQQPPPALLKPPKPSPFAGSTKDKENLEDWLFALDTYFGALPAPPNDLQKINFVASFFAGTARKWWRINAPTYTAPGATYAQFTAAFRTAFSPHNMEQKARDKMDALRQTTSVTAYTNRFRELMLEVPNMAAPELLHRYISGLKPRTKEHLMINNPATLDDAMNMADRVDSTSYEARQAAGNHRGNRNNRRQQWSRPAYRPAPQGPTPMELGAMQPQRRRLTPQERQYLINNNGCFYCRKLGHTLQQCKMRPNRNNRARPIEQQPKNGQRRSS
jgi:chemotaxis protein histidine kinase CheA